MSFRLTPAVSAALRTGRYPIAPMVQVQLPGYTLSHLVGSAEVMWNGVKFVGVDARFGTLTAAGNITDGTGDEAPDWDLTFAPPDNASVVDLTNAANQGSVVRGWVGVIDPATGLLLPDPVQVFAGTLDIARLRVGKGTRTVEWRCVSALEVFHDEETGARLSDAWHKLVWPAETGCANMTGVEKTSYWGVENPPSNVTYQNSAYSGTVPGIALA